VAASYQAAHAVLVHVLKATVFQPVAQQTSFWTLLWQRIRHFFTWHVTFAHWRAASWIILIAIVGAGLVSVYLIRHVFIRNHAMVRVQAPPLAPPVHLEAARIALAADDVDGCLTHLMAHCLEVAVRARYATYVPGKTARGFEREMVARHSAVDFIEVFHRVVQSAEHVHFAGGHVTASTAASLYHTVQTVTREVAE